MGEGLGNMAVWYFPPLGRDGVVCNENTEIAYVLQESNPIYLLG